MAVNNLILEEDRINVLTDKMSILNYSGYLINNITLPECPNNGCSCGVGCSLYSNFIWNRDLSILYNCNGQYLQAISNTSQVLWKYPLDNYQHLYLSEDEKYIFIEKSRVNLDSQLISLRIPF